MKVFIKTFSVLMMIIIITSFSKIDEKRKSTSLIDQTDIILIDDNLKYEMAVENLGLLGNQKLKELDKKNLETSLNQATNQPILSKRKARSYKSSYKGSFYRAYELD